MAEKKKSKPFTESDITSKGFIEVSPNVFVKAESPIQKLTREIKASHEKPIESILLKDNGFIANDLIRNGKYGVSNASDRTFNGKIYDSKLEMRYAQHLDLLTKAGEVIRVEEQVPFELTVNGKKVCTYILDFRVTYKDTSKVYIDVKGMATAIYRIKKKLFEALMAPITITEIKKGDF